MIGVKRNRNKDTPYKTQAPLSRVELHVHLDGSMRHETIYELALKKGITLPGSGSFADLRDYLVAKNPKDLEAFLKPFDIIVAVLKEDLKALERLGYEAVEDSANSGLLYFEARFCPHLHLPDDVAHAKGRDPSRQKWAYDVTAAVIKGLERGYSDFGCRGNLIATVIRGFQKEWYDDTLDIVADSSFHGGRIVGVDIAALPNTSCEKLMTEKDPVEFFDAAAKLGIHRTIHAGESGAAEQVTAALDVLHAERIGHGYRIVHDHNVYKRVQDDNVHLECCPWSSILTGSILLTHFPHPVVKFFEDGMNVSVNTDDPTCTGTRLEDEYRLLSNWGLNETHFVRGTFNAARSCFLPENEKDELLQNLAKTYGFVQ